MRRFSRIITHQAVGLVLGGGGAKGFSHIGAAKAMLEAGIEFDFVGGTSAGGLFGVGLTFTDFDIPQVTHLSKKGADSKPTSNDYNFPFLSLMTGRKMRKFLYDIFGETYLEDIWVNTFTISTNYSTASLKVHEKGLTRQVVEASIAIPGVFPPVIIDRHLHVDGGVMDNLPIEAMYQLPVHHVIAISLTAQSPHLVDIKTVPSAWEYFMNKFTKKHRYRLPPISGLLINSLILNSKQKQETTKGQIAMYLELDLRSYGFLDWSKWEKLIEKGYTYTQEFLKQQPTTEKFWKK
jgi:predicted acylesterase/phospholipase RssA